MAIARKCDRCGSFYEYKCAPEIWITNISNPYMEQKIDLCPNCRKNLKAWLGIPSRGKLLGISEVSD